MQLASTTGSDIVLAGLTIPHTGHVSITPNQYLADEERRAKINALYLDGSITVAEEVEFNGTDEDHDSFYFLPDEQFPSFTEGELERLLAGNVDMGQVVFLRCTVPSTLTVADGVDTMYAPFAGKIVGVALTVGTDPQGADLVVGLKKNGTDVFAVHTADRPKVVSTGGVFKGVAGPAFGGAAFNAANAGGLVVAAGDLLKPTITAIGTTSSHHGADLAVLVAIQALATEVSTDD